MFIVPNSTNVLAQISPNAPRPTTVSLLGKNRILDRNTNDTVRRTDFTKKTDFTISPCKLIIFCSEVILEYIILENRMAKSLAYGYIDEIYASIKLLYQTFITLRTKTICLPHQTWQGIYSALLISFIVCLRQKTSKASPCY